MVQETREVRLERALKELNGAAEGIKAAVVVNNDGLLVSAYPPGDEDNPHQNPTSSPQVAAMSATLIGLAERTLGRLQQGELERLLMEGEDGVMVVYPAGRATLAVLVDKEQKLGPVLYAAARTAKDVTEIL